jgi:hypothetical protein
MPNVSIPETASASRMPRLIVSTSGISTWPGSFEARNLSTFSITGSIPDSGMSKSRLTRRRKST